MPEATRNLTPRGQAYGQKAQQERFVQSTAPPPAPGPSEPEPTHDVEGIGDLGEMLFAPTERPNEPLTAPVAPPGIPAPPPDQYVRFAQSPNASPQTRALVNMITRLRSTPAPRMQPTPDRIAAGIAEPLNPSI